MIQTSTPIFFGGNDGSSCLSSILNSFTSVCLPIYEPLYNLSPSDPDSLLFVSTFFNSDPHSIDVPHVEEFANRRKLDCDIKHNISHILFKIRPHELNLYNLHKSNSSQKCVVLRRINIIKHAISTYRRLIDNCSQFTAGSFNLKSQINIPLFEKVCYLCILQDIDLGVVASAMGERLSLRISYEDILFNTRFVISQVFMHLGIGENVPANIDLNTLYFQKSTPNNLEECILNYSKLADWANIVGLSHFLTDDAYATNDTGLFSLKQDFEESANNFRAKALTYTREEINEALLSI